MHKNIDLSKSIGKLIKHKRSLKMDQTELGLRVGLGRNTISAIENGKGVNSHSLFKVLEFLGLIDDFQILVDTQLKQTSNKALRKTRQSEQVLDNDF